MKRAKKGAAVGAAVAAFAAVEPHVSVADPAPARISVLAPASPSPLMTDAALRLAGELRSGGLDAVVGVGEPGGDPCALADANSEPAPIATIFIGPARVGTAVDVWVCDRITQKAVMRHMDAKDDAESLAIRGAELLRASLIEVAIEPRAKLPDDVARWLGPMPAATPATVPEPPAPEAPHAAATTPSAVPASFEASTAPSPQEDPFRDASDVVPPPTREPKVTKPVAEIGVGVALLSSFTGFPAALGPELDARYRTAIGVEVAARAAAAFAPKDLPDSMGQTNLSATLRHGVGAASALYRFGNDTWPLRPALGSGLGVYVLDVNGTGTGTHLAHHTLAASFVPTIDAGIEMHFHERVRGELDVSALFPLPDPAVFIDGARAGLAGEPLVLASLGIAVVL